MKKSRVSRIVTAVIIALILVSAAMTGIKILGARGSQNPGGSGAQGQPGAQGGTPGQQSVPGQGQGGQGARNATVVRAAPVVLGTIENSVVINGDVLARSQVTLYPTVAGRLVETRFRVGDTIRQGETAAMIDPSRPGEVYSHSPVVSTITGTVLQAPVNPGDTLTTQSAVYVVGDLRTLVVETFVPERFTTAVRLGLAAQVSFEAMPGETFRARVDEASPVLDPASRTQRIRLRFDPPSGLMDPRIRAGMFATISLVTNSRSNVPVIPRGAAINTYGSWIVFTAEKGGIAKRRVIRLGLESDDLLEVTEGLNVGDMVVTAGQNFLSDNEPVRVAE
jgi:multidrug efflux pump subunit AcrA (membrane-fusion protein)